LKPWEVAPTTPQASSGEVKAMDVTVTFAEGEVFGMKMNAATPRTRRTTTPTTAITNQTRRRGGGLVVPSDDGEGPTGEDEAGSTLDGTGPGDKVSDGAPLWLEKAVAIPRIEGRQRYLGASSWRTGAPGKGSANPGYLGARER
jgi:hypothetical protein